MPGRNRQRCIPHFSTPRSPDSEIDGAAKRLSRLPDVPSDPALDLLEQLDDIIFEAIRGCTTSLARAEQLWPKTVARLGWEAVEESREQYLRYALDVTRHSDEHFDFVNRGLRSPKQSLVALEVIELLMRSEES
jgi:hypothetical protein